jgi:hypothetical protein
MSFKLSTPATLLLGQKNFSTKKVEVRSTLLTGFIDSQETAERNRGVFPRG